MLFLLAEEKTLTWIIQRLIKIIKHGTKNQIAIKLLKK